MKQSTQQSSPFFVTDLDATLLQNDGTLSAFAAKTLAQMLESGLNFTVASARSIVSIREALGTLPLRLPVIEINGAFITDYQTCEHIIIHDIPDAVLHELYPMILEHECACFVSTYNGSEDCLYHPEILNEGIRFYFDNRYFCQDKRLRPLISHHHAFEDHVVALTVINTIEKLKPLALSMRDRFAWQLTTHLFENPYSPGWWWLTIHDIDACKSKAIQEIAHQCGLDLEHLTVFGDSTNDIEMFRIAPNAVAVENAIEPVKDVATEIIGPNTEDAVTRYIRNRVKT